MNIWIRVNDDDTTAHWNKPEAVKNSTIICVEYDEERPTIYDESGEEIGIEN